MTSLVNSISRFFYQRDLGLLSLRVATGLIFLTHGWMKVNDLGMVGTMFAQMGFAPVVGIIIAWLEVIGGLALILGVLTRVFGVIFGIEMLVATIIIGFSRGISIDFYLMMVCFALALMGSGQFSILRGECPKCGGMLCNGETGICVAAE